MMEILHQSGQGYDVACKPILAIPPTCIITTIDLRPILIVRPWNKQHWWEGVVDHSHHDTPERVPSPWIESCIVTPRQPHTAFENLNENRILRWKALLAFSSFPFPTCCFSRFHSWPHRRRQRGYNVQCHPEHPPGSLIACQVIR